MYHHGEPYYIDFCSQTHAYTVNGKARIQLPKGITFGIAPGVTGKPSAPSDAPPKDGITFKAEGAENRAKFLTKSLVIPTGAVYLTNGMDTMAITVALTGHTTFWQSQGGSKWVAPAGPRSSRPPAALRTAASSRRPAPRWSRSASANATIHKVNECARVEDIDQLSLVYERVMEKLLAP